MKFHALLVGINRYQKIRGLNACEIDVNNVKRYLTSKHGKDANVKTLFNEEATYDQIIKTFRQHLGKAEKDDVALFYFSGHGVRQRANSVFKIASPNSLLECLVCHDAPLDGRKVLADKELRWLIHELYQNTQCHIVVVFDCCHSGDATRGLGDVEPPKGDMPLKRMALPLENTDNYSRLPELILDERKWSDFCFSLYIQESEVKKVIANGDSLDTIMPQGKHIHLAACSSNEPAWEISGSSGTTGIFTYALLETLKATNEQITYYDFRSLTYQYLNRLYGGKEKDMRQAPQIYSYGQSIFQPFFGGIIRQKGIEANLYYNTTHKQWEFDMGAIYGIPEPTAGKMIQLCAKLDAEGNQTAFVYIKKVFSDYSVVGFEESEERRQAQIGKVGIAPPLFDKNKKEGYKCSIKKLLQKPLKVAFVGKEMRQEWQSFCQNNAPMLDLASVIPVNSESNADYVINTDRGLFFIAYPKSIEKPLIEHVSKNDGRVFEIILGQFEHISRWEFVKSHENKTSKNDLLDKIAIRCSVNNGATLMPKNDIIDIHFHFDKYSEGYYSKEQIGIDIINTSSEPLFIAASWLAERFGIDGNILGQNSIATEILASNTIRLWGETMPFVYQNNIKNDNWLQFSNFLKVYVSTKPFDITLLNQAELPPPTNTRGTKGIGRPNNEAMGDADKIEEWAVKTLEFVVYP
jgi:hypothetical protein